MKVYTILKNIAKKVSLDYVHPVGEIFISVDASFNPNNTWGGVWQKLTDKFLVGAGNEYTLGATGGNKTHYHNLPIGFDQTHFYGSVTMQNDYGSIVTQAQHATVVSSSNYPSTATRTSYSSASGTLPPYQAVYMWQRTA